MLPIGLVAGVRQVDACAELGLHRLTYDYRGEFSLTYWSQSAPLFRSWVEINQEEVNDFEQQSRPFRKFSRIYRARDKAFTILTASTSGKRHRRICDTLDH